MSEPFLPLTQRPATQAKATKKATKTHPPVSEMVMAAIKTLKQRGGSSTQAIKKYLEAQYLVDVGQLAHHIRKFLKSSVENGTLTQTKGKGAAGSFKLPSLTKKKKTEEPKAAAEEDSDDDYPPNPTQKMPPREPVKVITKKKAVKKVIKKKTAGPIPKVKKPVVKNLKKPAAKAKVVIKPKKAVSKKTPSKKAK